MNVTVKTDGPLGFLTKPEDMPAATHPNTSRYFAKGVFPPQELLLPLGALFACQILRNSEGASKDLGLIIPDTITQTWVTPLYVITHVGPEVKWVKRGDVIGVPSRVDFVIVRTDGWEILVAHEQQAHFTLPNKNQLGVSGDQLSSAQQIAANAMAAAPVSDMVLAKGYNAITAQDWAGLSAAQRDTWWAVQIARNPGSVCADCETCKFPMASPAGPCGYCDRS